MQKISDCISEKELALEYNSAKIIASPYNYKLSERVMIYDSNTCATYFNIFDKSNNTEKYLATALSLKDANYLDINPSIKSEIDISAETLGTVTSVLNVFEHQLGTIGSLIKYNNLILSEQILLKDLSYLTAKTKDLKTKNYLKALEVWHLMGTDAASLIPNLMYLVTEYCDRSLDDIENIKFAEEAIAAGVAPVVAQNRYYDDTVQPLASNMLLDAAAVPIYLAPRTIIDYSGGACTLGFDDLNNGFYTLGLFYAVIYGAELLYYFNNIKDDTLKIALEELLNINYHEDTFCSEYLYRFDDVGHLDINPDIKACFDSDNETRFNNIRNLYKSMLKTPIFYTNIAKGIDKIGLPIFFARMIMSMHSYAYQVCKIKHATLLYKRAKDAGVISKEDFNDTISRGDDELFGFGSASSSDDDDYMNNELIDLNTFSDTDIESSSEEMIEKEKEVSKKKKDLSIALNAADRLKKDLHDSPYDFDITYVKNDVSDKDAYNLISSNIKMITHELTRQIKDIKTYNTGGKQGGLLVGKLDKKNLWKYKTDPHIFYNNNYKLKEMDLAFGCILDESGSMYGDKIKNGRIVMIMLHEVLNSLGINHSIIGHTSSGMYQSKIFKYFQFKEEAHYTLDKPYGLVKATNRSGNCDSGSLYYMQSVMKQVRNKDKIVIIFSDGQPTECTDLDLTNQVKAMEKSGIHVIGVGINFESIKEYYPDNANGKNLKEMVDIVVSILKRYVLEKKER